MSRARKSVDFVQAEYYDTHLSGDSKRFSVNPSGNRTLVLQRMYTRVLTELAMNRFKWHGMPDSVSIRFLEMQLFYRALAIFFHEENWNKFIVMAGSGTGNMNMVEDPTMFAVFGNQYPGRRLHAMRHAAEDEYGNKIRDDAGDIVMEDAECVPIWANYLRVPDLDIVTIYAQRLAELDMTIEINTKSARRTKIIAVDENQRLTARNINRAIDDGDTAIEIADGAQGLMPTALDIGVHPDSIEKLSILRSRVWSECMTLLGINNANQDKKERLVASEVDANDEQVDATKAVALNARRMAVQQINDRYGLMLSVEYNTDIDKQLETMMVSSNFGAVHDAAASKRISEGVV